MITLREKGRKRRAVERVLSLSFVRERETEEEEIGGAGTYAQKK